MSIHRCFARRAGVVIATATALANILAAETSAFADRQDASDGSADARFRESQLFAADFDGRWTRPFGAPPARSGHSIVEDFEGGRLFMFGGNPGGQPRNDTWVLDLDSGAQWKQVETIGVPPPARYRHAAIFDPIRGRMIVFAGAGNSFYNDVWALSVEGLPDQPAEWTRILPAGTPPLARYGAAAIYDAFQDRLVFFSGSNDSSYLNDVWALSIGATPTWTRLLPVGGPDARWGHSAVYDPIESRMIVFGGFGVGLNKDDTWVLNLWPSLSWQLIYYSPRPPARREHVAAYDALRRRMYIHGGMGPGPRSDLWRLDLSSAPQLWTQPATAGTAPTARRGHAGVYDFAGDRMILFGGADALVDREETYRLSLDDSLTWTGGDLRRRGHTTILDVTRNRIIAFGGTDGSVIHNDVLVLNLDAPEEWQPMSVAGTPPSPRQYHSAIYDPIRDRMIVFGGTSSTQLNDVYALDLATDPSWVSLTPVGEAPSPRRMHSAIYDPTSDRMVIHGGWNGSIKSDTWALGLSDDSWMQLSATGGDPPQWFAHRAVYDAIRRRMIVFGGQDPFGRHNFTWALSLVDHLVWSEIDGTFPRPSYRDLHSMVFDETRNRLVVFGGIDDSGARNDSWALSLDGEPTWDLLTLGGITPSRRYGHDAVYESTSDRMFASGGFGDIGDETNVLTFDRATGIPIEHDLPNTLVVGGPTPNPFRSKVRLSYSQETSSPLRIEVFDVSGRRVRAFDAAGARSSEVSWDGRDDGGRQVARGLYFIQLRSPEQLVVRRVVRF